MPWGVRRCRRGDPYKRPRERACNSDEAVAMEARFMRINYSTQNIQVTYIYAEYI